MKFTSRTLMACIAIVGLSCGWFATWQRVIHNRIRYEQQLVAAEKELLRARDQLHELARGKHPDLTRSFWEAELDGSNLAEMTIASPGNAFQGASFRNCRLEDAVLSGGAASFQLARFDGAKLARAKISGGDCSFQESTFVKADLTGATLAGGFGSFQAASFEDAVMIGAKLSGSFQVANFSGVKLQGADLSALQCNDLVSCYFSRPPTYDAKTKFPAGFDPREHLWQPME